MSFPGCICVAGVEGNYSSLTSSQRALRRLHGLRKPTGVRVLATTQPSLPQLLRCVTLPLDTVLSLTFGKGVRIPVARKKGRFVCLFFNFSFWILPKIYCAKFTECFNKHFMLVALKILEDAYNHGNLLKDMENFLKKKKAHRRDRYKFCLNIRWFMNIIHRTLQRLMGSRLRFLSSWKWKGTSFSVPLRISVLTRGSMNPKWLLFQGIQEEGEEDHLGECYWRYFTGNSQQSTPGTFSCSRKQCSLMPSISGKFGSSPTWIHDCDSC